MNAQDIRRLYMDTAHLLPEHGYSIRTDGEVNVNRKAVELVGGVDSMVKRVVGIWLGMPEHYRGVGMHWYDEAYEFAANLADVYGLTIWQVAQVIAVLSPQNSWNGKFDKNGVQWADGNRLCALKTIKAYVEGGAAQVKELRGWGYAGAFTDKAIRVLDGQELEWSKAPKTHRFALLIADPTREDIVVCDSHASRIATGNLGNRYHVVALSAYALIDEAYMLAGTILGIPAYVAQSGEWQYAVDGHLYGIGGNDA